MSNNNEIIKYSYYVIKSLKSLDIRLNYIPIAHYTYVLVFH